ncbi:HNH endonuclease [Wukongibacter baidiensis]
MISINGSITPAIKERHVTYIVNNNKILKRLGELKKKGAISFPKNYIDKYNSDRGKSLSVDELESSVKKLIDDLLEEINELKVKELKDVSDDNMFIAEPQQLSVKIQKLIRDHDIVTKVLDWESQLKYNPNNNVKPIISKKISKAIGYKKFTKISIKTSMYIDFLDSLRAKHSNCFKQLKAKSKSGDSSSRYTKDQLEWIKREVCVDIKKYSISNELENLHKLLCGEIMGIDTSSKQIGVLILIEEINSKVEKYYDECKEAFNKLDITTLNYNQLFDSTDNAWDAYHFVMMLDIRTCPYCNRQYITPAFHEEDGCIRADLDHFYPKSKYPYLAMSLYNLVPCCKFCNSSLKLKKPFSYETHLNPYEGGFDELLKFSFRPKKYNLSGDDKYKIEILLKESVDLNDKKKALLQKSQNNAKVFKVETLYNYHCQEVEDIIKKRIVYSKNFVNEIKKALKAISSREITDKEVLEFILPNYIGKEKLHERTLAKLYKDIVEELSLSCKDSSSIELPRKEREKLIQFIK